MKTLFGLPLITLTLLTQTARAEPTVTWVQMVAGHAEARTVVDSIQCPVVIIDGHAVKMTQRAGPTEDFTNRVCTVSLPVKARNAAIEGQDLPLPKQEPRRLVILGDSGCRVKGSLVQACNTPGGWPFAKVAALAAARKPDLVIHVGDYYYRESPCPPDQSRACGGSPFGDKWPTWKAELFNPAARLLAAAPWVFTRGNHEDCQRGGPGWFRLLDAAPAVKTCPASSDTFAVDIGGAELLVVDSADTIDGSAPPDRVAAFLKNIDGAIGAHGGPPIWIVTHRPIWNALRLGEKLSDGLVNATERAAVKGQDLGRVQMVLAGHVHNFTSLDFASARPTQLIVGEGGDLMDANDLPTAVEGHLEVDGMAAQVFTLGRWGYFVFDRSGSDWVGAFRDLTDRVAAVCRLHDRALHCKAPG